jgi:hypothetical protein
MLILRMFLDQKSSKVLKQAPLATYLLHADTAGNFSATRGESFYSTAVMFVKVLKQWGLELTISN